MPSSTLAPLLPSLRRFLLLAGLRRRLLWRRGLMRRRLPPPVRPPLRGRLRPALRDSLEVCAAVVAAADAA